jgi:hypothetical protein
MSNQPFHNQAKLSSTSCFGVKLHSSADCHAERSRETAEWVWLRSPKLSLAFARCHARAKRTRCTACSTRGYRLSLCFTVHKVLKTSSGSSRAICTHAMAIQHAEMTAAHGIPSTQNLRTHQLPFSSCDNSHLLGCGPGPLTNDLHYPYRGNLPRPHDWAQIDRKLTNNPPSKSVALCVED